MKRKVILMLALLLMIVGFAAITSTLNINGTVSYKASITDFDIYFSKAIVNNITDNSVIIDDVHIEFTTELKKINQEYVLEYDVTNGSTEYDFLPSIKIGSYNTEYLSVTNIFDTSVLEARQTRRGKLIIKLIKNNINETPIQDTITIEIKATASSRDDLVLDDVPDKVESNKTIYTIVNDVNSNGIADVGDEINITGTNENFYIINNNNGRLSALAKYNLNVGGEFNDTWVPYETTSGLQDSNMLGYIYSNSVSKGTIEFSKVTNIYSGSSVEDCVNDYIIKLNNLSPKLNATGRLINSSELNDLGCLTTDYFCTTAQPWVYSTSYWTGFADISESVWIVDSAGNYYNIGYDYHNYYGVRPVIEIDE